MRRCQDRFGFGTQNPRMVKFIASLRICRPRSREKIPKPILLRPETRRRNHRHPFCADRSRKGFGNLAMPRSSLERTNFGVTTRQTPEDSNLSVWDHLSARRAPLFTSCRCHLGRVWQSLRKTLYGCPSPTFCLTNFSEISLPGAP